MFGSGPGALPSDARTHGIDPVLLRDRQDEALGVIIRLLRGEDRFSYESDWFTLHDAQLQLLPVQEDMPMATASSISPSGMQLAGKYGIGVLSIASNSTEGIQALPTQWGVRRGGRGEARLDRRPPRLARADGVPPRRDQRAGPRARPSTACTAGTTSTTCGRSAGRARCTSRTRGTCSTARPQGGAEGAGAAVVGTPDDLVAAIRHLQEITGGFGVVLGFAHDWADREATLRSWELFARYVVPELNGYTAGLRASQQYLHDNQAELMGGASRAVMSKIMAHEGAAKAMATTMEQMQASRRQRRRGRSGPGAGVPTSQRLTTAKATAAAWPTLSESTPASIGMRTRRSAAARAPR